MLEKYHARAAASANDLRTDCDVCREQTQKMSLQVGTFKNTDDGIKVGFDDNSDEKGVA